MRAKIVPKWAGGGAQTALKIQVTKKTLVSWKKVMELFDNLAPPGPFWIPFWCALDLKGSPNRPFSYKINIKSQKRMSRKVS